MLSTTAKLLLITLRACAEREEEHADGNQVPSVHSEAAIEPHTDSPAPAESSFDESLASIPAVSEAAPAIAPIAPVDTAANPDAPAAGSPALTTTSV